MFFQERAKAAKVGEEEGEKRREKVFFFTSVFAWLFLPLDPFAFSFLLS